MSAPGPVRIALLGCGTVGRRVAQLLIEQADRLERAIGRPIELARILVREPSRDRGLCPSLNPGVFTARFEDVLLDQSIDLAIEVIGGIEPAREYVSRLLARGVPVVTANKSLVAHHGSELHEIAERAGTVLVHEACVGGAVPILATLRGLAGDEVKSVRGIINGSCNFILSRMTRDGCSLDEAVAEARVRGLVEPDPSADLSGRDAAEKLCIIAQTLGRMLRLSDVECRGIESISCEDIAAARRAGGVIRLIAELDDRGARVEPVILPARHPMANVRDEDNAVIVQAELAGELLLKGRGAGPDPTASCILGDVARALGLCHGLTAKRQAVRIAHVPSPAHGAIGCWFVRIASTLAPETVLVALRDHGIEPTHVEWRGRAISFIVDGATRQVVIDAARALGDACALVVPWVDERVPTQIQEPNVQVHDSVVLEAAA